MKLELQCQSFGQALRIAQSSLKAGAGDEAIPTVYLYGFVDEDQGSLMISRRTGRVTVPVTGRRIGEDIGIVELPARQLTTITGSNFDSDVQLDLGGKRATVQVGKSRMVVPFRVVESIDALQYKKTAKMRVTKSLFLKSLQASSVAQGRVSYHGWQMDSIELQLNDGKLRTFSFDGTKICETTIPVVKYDTPNAKTMIYGLQLGTILSFIKALPGDEVNLTFSETNFVVTSQDSQWKLEIGCVNGKFPDMSKIESATRDIWVRFQGDDLARSLITALDFTQDDRTVDLILSVDDGCIKISAESSLMGRFDDEIEASIECDNDHALSLDGKLLAEYLKLFPKAEMSMNVSDDDRIPLYVLYESKELNSRYMMTRTSK